MTTESPITTTTRVLLTARDRETGRSQSVTLYGTTPEAVIEAVKEMTKQHKPRRKQPAS